MKRMIDLLLLVLFVIIGGFTIFYNNLVMGLTIFFLGLLLILIIDQATYAVKDTKENQTVKIICIISSLAEYLFLTFVGLIFLIELIQDIITLNTLGTLVFGLVFSYALFEGNFIMRDKKEYNYVDVEKKLIFLIIAIALFLITLRLSGL